MLDILGNVFGRGKKDKNGQPITPGSPSASRDASSSSTSDPFNVVESDTNGQANIVYPILLRDDMLRPAPTSSDNDPSSSTSSTLPFSSNTWNSHTDHKSDTLKNGLSNMNAPHFSSQGSLFPSSSQSSQTNPMDNVPFIPNPTFDSVRNGFGSNSSLFVSSSSSSDPFARSLQAVERIGQFLATPSSSEYQFREERRQLKESNSSNGWIAFE